jgi:riboflavin kinase/FMN adenylyltransferase
MKVGSRPIALTIGVFDGVHRGHQAILAATTAAARAAGGAAGVATFDPHPDTVVRGEPDRSWITPPEERSALMHRLGIDRVEVIRFDESVMRLTPEEFLDRALGAGASLRTLVLGPDFRMGKGRIGDRAYLEGVGRARGFDVVEVPFLTGSEGKLSSTLLRRAISEGRMEAAAEIMGRPYALEGPVGSGAGRGRSLGYPTANLELHPQKLLPAAGIYLSNNEIDENSLPGLTYIGSAGTFGPGPTRVEVHLIDQQASLRGRPLKTLLISRLRADQVFGSAEDLVKAMDDDLARARRYWAEAGTSRPGGC